MTLGFGFAAAGLVALAWALLWPALRPRAGVPAAAPAVDAPRAAGHLQILQEQLAAVDADHAAGRIGVDEHARARAEIERRALEDEALPAAPTRVDNGGGGSKRHRLAAGVAVAVPVLAFGLYGLLGNGAALQPGAAADGDASPQEVARLLADMEKQLAAKAPEPSDAQGWTMLARSYAALEQFEPARRAFDRAMALAPADAQLLADQADVVAMLQGRRTAGEPARLIERSLQLDPSNLKALALAGSIAFDARDFATAARHWARARELAPPDTEFAAGLDRSLAEARAAAGDAPTAAAATVAATGAPAGAAGGASGAATGVTGGASVAPTGAPSVAAAGVAGRVTLAPALAGRVAPGDTVFVFARAVDGPRMPLAIVRRTVADLPFDFRLDDAMAMSPQMKLSKFDRVVVVARVSRSGSALPGAGDLLGETAPIGNRADGVAVTISGVQP